MILSSEVIWYSQKLCIRCCSIGSIYDFSVTYNKRIIIKKEKFLMQTVAFCKCFLIFVLKGGKENVGALLRKSSCDASYSIWTLHFICTHNVSFGCAVHLGSPCTWFYHIKKSDVNTKHSALCLCSAFVPYAHIHEHCFNYAMDKSVSWDIVECNGLLLPSLFLSRQIWIRSLFKRYICSHSTRLWTTTTAGKKNEIFIK